MRIRLGARFCRTVGGNTVRHFCRPHALAHRWSQRIGRSVGVIAAAAGDACRDEGPSDENVAVERRYGRRHACACAAAGEVNLTLGW